MFRTRNLPELVAGQSSVSVNVPAALPRRSYVSTGFVPVNDRLHRFYNLCLGMLLLLAALPLLAVLTVAVFATQGWRVFYCGPRICLGGKIYNIYKFRTLDDRRAREITRDRVLPADSGIETPLGAFLRDTRLDELPQLLNVVLGDMNICGPRPVRPEMATTQRLRISDYDVRFNVRPGLIGHTQAYMHHGTSKALRARYNRVICQAPVRYRGELGMIARVGICVLVRTGHKIWERLAERFLGRDENFRERAAARDFRLSFVNDEGVTHPVVQASRARMAFDPEATIGDATKGNLVLTLPSGAKRQAKIALTDQGDGVYTYESLTEYGHHVVSRYLWQAVVVPHQSRFWNAAL